MTDQNLTGLIEPKWLRSLRHWAYPDTTDSIEVEALKKAGRVITQMHNEKVWCSADVADTLALIQSALRARTTASEGGEE